MYAQKCLLAGMMMLGMLAGCGQDVPPVNPKARVDIPLTRTEQELADESTDFAFRFFRQVCGSETTKPNLFVSPFSASLCLAMVANGADGNTLAEMLTTLGFRADDHSIDDLNNYYQKLMTTLPDLDNTTQLSIANSIWVKQGFNILPDFVSINNKKFGASVTPLDFASPQAVATINKWCADNTNNLIPKVLDNIPQEARLFLINTLYFKGIWKSPFDKKDTRKGGFTRADGSRADVDMMQQTYEFSYVDRDTYSMVTLPYGNSAFSMTVLLPHEGVKVDEAIAGLTAAEWTEALNGMWTPEVDLKLPRFKMEYDRMLNDDMMALGMKDAFDGGQADFSRMSSTPLFLSMLKQSAYVNVDEAGTEAAAVTVGGMGVTSVMPPGRVTFHVDRPFAFFIKELSTGVILFMGRVNSL
jgi:serpin B